MKAVENCENCGRAIGRLEQPFLWRTHVVCAECHARLAARTPRKAPATQPAAVATPVAMPVATPVATPPAPAAATQPNSALLNPITLGAAGGVLLVVVLATVYYVVRCPPPEPIAAVTRTVPRTGDAVVTP